MWSNQKHKDVIKDDKEDVFQYLPDILSDIVVTKFQNKRKYEQFSLSNYGENGKLDLETDVEEDALDIIFIIQKMVDSKQILIIKVYLYYEESILKSKCVYHNRI